MTSLTSNIQSSNDSNTFLSVTMYFPYFKLGLVESSQHLCFLNSISTYCKNTVYKLLLLLLLTNITVEFGPLYWRLCVNVTVCVHISFHSYTAVCVVMRVERSRVVAVVRGQVHVYRSWFQFNLELKQLDEMMENSSAIKNRLKSFFKHIWQTLPSSSFLMCRFAAFLCLMWR